MKRILVLVFVLGLCGLFSCSDDIAEQSKITDFYYVKYVWSVNPTYRYGNTYDPFIISCKNNTGEFFNIKDRINDELILGPFIYGYKTEMYVKNASLSDLEIYVSKNNSPFALKAKYNTIYLEYTIDF